jgi:hypothetical protein
MRVFLIVLFAFSFPFTTGPLSMARAQSLEPESSLVVTSAKDAFPLDTRFPKEWWFALDQRMDVAITSLTIGEESIAAAGQSLMKRQSRTCSLYDSAICFDTSHFYRPDIPQIILSGYAKLDGTNALLFGLDTGFRAQKINISPALMLGLSHRTYLSERRDAQFVVEFAGWLGQSVSHTPCYDSYDRAYYCGNLSAWSDFSYNAHPTEVYAKIWFEYAF